jgi:hypothetical protein
MRINNGDDTKPDFMEVAVKQKHIIQYKEPWEKFRKENDINRAEYSAVELMNLISFRNKYEYNKALIILPSDSPDYKRLICDFSIQLTPQDIHLLRQIDGQVEEIKTEEKTPQGKSNQEKMLKLMEYMLEKIEAMDSRITTIEQTKGEQ